MMNRTALLTLLLFVILQVSYSLAAGMTNDFYSGDWKLHTAAKESLLLDIPQVITMKLTAQPDSANIYRVNIKVANILMSSLEIISKEENGEMKIKAGPVASTRMMPPPELEPLEFFFGDYFPQLDTMKLEEDVLVMKGGGAEIKWQQAIDEKDAA